MNKRTVITLSVLIVLSVAGIIGYLAWNKPFTDPLKGSAIKVSAIQLFNDFNSDEAAAQKKYVPLKVDNKIIEVSGIIKETGKNEDGESYYILQSTNEMFGVKCIMQKGYEIADAKVGDAVTVRGFCDGYNLDVIVNRCKPAE